VPTDWQQKIFTSLMLFKISMYENLEFSIKFPEYAESISSTHSPEKGICYNIPVAYDPYLLSTAHICCCECISAWVHYYGQCGCDILAWLILIRFHCSVYCIVVQKVYRYHHPGIELPLHDRFQSSENAYFWVTEHFWQTGKWDFFT